ncbi:CHAT domain-containing protein [Pseudomonas laurentiana]
MSTDLVDLHFRIVSKGGHYSVSLTCGDEPPVEAIWRAEAFNGTEFNNNLRTIEQNTCTWHDINYVGGQLWLGLTPDHLGKIFAQQCCGVFDGQDFLIRLEIPDDCRSYPWESLYDRGISSLGLSERPRYGIVHHPPTEARIAPFEPHDGATLTMLIIAPENTQLDVSREINGIRTIALKRGIKPVELCERVTVSKVYEQLHNKRWDIVHYVGHGEVNAQNRLDIMLNSDDGSCLRQDAEIFCHNFQTATVRLAVFNCCRSNGDHQNSSVVSGLGPMLMRMGVPAVVTMRYEIFDHLASAFARYFYDSLLIGESAGRVDVAIGVARAALSRACDGSLRSCITPILHLAPNYHQLFNLHETVPDNLNEPNEREIQEPPGAILRRPAVEPILHEAIRQGRCVAIIGPGILQAGITRRPHAAPPGPLDLINLLAKNIGYPLRQDLELCKPGQSGCGWIQYSVLQWVCQHYVQQAGGWETLADVICQQYLGREAPELMKAFAEIRFAAVFYTWFDGYLQDLVSRGRSGLTEVLSVKTPHPVEAAGLTGERRPLVLLRGSVQHPDSLVITEDDHEKLASDIAGMVPELSQLTRSKARCCVLFIGVNPRDPLVRQLCQKLLDRRVASRRSQGPTFFLTLEDDCVDHPYWVQYDTRWIRCDLDPFLSDLIETLK